MCKLVLLHYLLFQYGQVGSLPTDSISFGRFEAESLCWERRSSFSHNRYLEEVVKCSKSGSVEEKKAYFESHFKKKPSLAPNGMIIGQTSDSDTLSPVGCIEKSRYLMDESINREQHFGENMVDVDEEGYVVIEFAKKEEASFFEGRPHFTVLDGERQFELVNEHLNQIGIPGSDECENQLSDVHNDAEILKLNKIEDEIESKLAKYDLKNEVKDAEGPLVEKMVLTISSSSRSAYTSNSKKLLMASSKVSKICHMIFLITFLQLQMYFFLISFNSNSF